MNKMIDPFRDISQTSTYFHPTGHAQQFIRETQELKFRYAGFITISGDGLVHEVYNGLWGRGDWSDLCDIPIGIVPGGSGNALNCSLLRQLRQPLDGTHHLGASWSGHNVAQGASEDKTVPLDLMEVELADGKKCISFFGVTIGLVADVDIGNPQAQPSATLSTSFQKVVNVLFKRFGSIAVFGVDESLHSGGHADPHAQILPRSRILLATPSGR